MTCYKLLLIWAKPTPNAPGVSRRVEATIKQLVEQPYLGSPRDYDDPRLHNLRQWPVQDFKNYLIFYRPFASSNSIEVLRVLHSSRDANAQLSEEATHKESSHSADKIALQVLAGRFCINDFNSRADVAFPQLHQSIAERVPITILNPRRFVGCEREPENWRCCVRARLCLPRSNCATAA